MLKEVFEVMETKRGLFPCQNVEDIALFIEGYSKAIEDYRLTDAALDIFKAGFDDFVIRKFGLESYDTNWVKTIRFYSGASHRESWDIFFKCYADFMAEQDAEKPGPVE